MRHVDELETPCVLIDATRVERNLRYRLRPHIKTHKLPRFARRQIELGATGITVQKLGEAEVMVDAGITDIFLAYDIVGATKLARLRALNDGADMAVVADNQDVLAGLAATFGPANHFGCSSNATPTRAAAACNRPRPPPRSRRPGQD